MPLNPPYGAGRSPRRRLDLALVATLASMALSLPVAATAATATAAPPVDYSVQLKLPTLKAPKLRNGQPDFQGKWNRYPDLLISPFLPNQPKANDPLATLPRLPRPPLKPQYKAILDGRWAAVAAAAARNEPIAERSVNCIPDGMPNMMRGVWIMEFLQTPEQINITQELYNQTRRVYMNEKLPALDELDAGYYGRSVGHFEGQVLVIETIGTRADIMATSGAPGGSGGGDVPHSPQLKFVERIRYIAADIIQDQITMTDPETMSEPWTWVFHYKKMPADYKMQEYVCDGNRTAVDDSGVQRRTDADTAAPAAKP